MPAPRRRFVKPGDDLEAKKAREEKSIEECGQLALDDSPDITGETEKLRERLMMEWKE